MNHTDRFRRILALLATRDPVAADEVEQLGRDLIALADRLRNERPPTSPGGASDRATLELVGPDGQIKQTVDTGLRGN